MLAAVLVFILVAGAVLGGYFAVAHLPAMLAERRLNQRLREVAGPQDDEEGDSGLVKRVSDGPLASVERAVSGTSAGSWLSRLIEQSGIDTNAATVIVMSLVFAGSAALFAQVLARQAWLAPIAAILAGAGPVAFLMNRRTMRMRRFEEYFPEGLDLLSRALRAGHAFQTAMGMGADELKAPVGPEFKKTFDQQNYGLPLRDALTQMADRVPVLDVRFFVTAVLIQRETGGNLAEILDNLSHVVRERFKIRRQVRVHTAHGRFTAFVLLALPAALAVALYMINPEHMEVLFTERMGQTMLVAAIIMQAVGFVWIRQVIKIEV